MRKIICICMALILICGMTVSAVVTEFSEGIPADWTFNPGTASVLGTAVQDTFLGENVLHYKGDSMGIAGGSMNSNMTGTAVDTSEPVVISVRGAITNAAATRRLFLVNSAGRSGGTLFEINTENKLSVFGGAYSASALPINTYFVITVAIDVANGKAVAWLDGNEIASSDSYSLSASNPGPYSIRFLHTFSGTNIVSSWYLNNVVVENVGSFNLTTSPADESVFVSLALLESLTLDFGTAVAPDTLDKIKLTNVTDTADVPISIKYFGNKLIITPVSPLISLKTYKLSWEDVKKPFDTAVNTGEIEFSTADAGYVAPTISITGSSGEVFSGADFSIIPDIVQGSSEIKSVSYYEGSTLIGTVDTAPYTFTYKSDAVGTLSIHALVTNMLGGTAKSNTITVNIKANALPVVSFDNIQTGSTLNYGVDTTAIVNATDDSLISKVELYCDGVFLAESSNGVSDKYTFDISSITVGMHSLTAIAYDEFSAKSQVTVNIVVTVVSLIELINVNFDTLSAGTVPTGLVVNSSENGGYVSAEVLPGGNGTKALILGAYSGAPINGGPYVANSSPAATGVILLETDFYLSTTAAMINFGLRTGQTGSMTNSQNFTLTGGNLEYYDGTVKSTKTGVYIDGQWLKLKYIVDVPRQKYSLYIDDVLVADDFSFREYVQSVSQIRIAIARADQDLVMGFDNYKLYQQIESPYIKSVEYEAGGNTTSNSNSVPVNTTKIIATLSAPLKASSVTLNTVSIYAGNKKIPLTSVSYADSKITFVVSAPFESVTEHELRLLSDLKLENDAPYGMQSVFKFTTQPLSFDVLSANVYVNGAASTNYRKNDKVSFKATIINESGTNQPVVLVLIVRDNGRFSQIITKTTEISDMDTQTFETDQITITASNPTVEAFILKGWQTRLPFSAKTY